MESHEYWFDNRGWPDGRPFKESKLSPGVRQVRLRALKRAMMRLSKLCDYCGKRLCIQNATLDHRIPRAYGGTDDEENLTIACRKCNHEKDDLSEAAYRQKFSKHKRYR